MDYPDLQAAVYRPDRKDLEIQTASIVEIRDDEVLVKVVATGVCHTDLTFLHDFMRLPYPAVLGHEGAGVVERVGNSVKEVAPGDHVVLTFMCCGQCPNCLAGHPSACDTMGAWNATGHRQDGSSALRCGGETVGGHFFGQSSFATYSVAHRRNVVKVRKDAPLELLGPLGCGVMTGAGAVLNVLRAESGKSFVVFGGGSVGLSALMAAKMAGCSPMVVVEPIEWRRKLAQELGADVTLDPAVESDIVARLRAVTGRGIQYAVDTCGIPAVISQAIQALAVSGKIVLLTANKMDAAIPLSLMDTMGRSLSILGSTEGHSNPAAFIPMLVDRIMSGDFPLAKLVRYYDFKDLGSALEDARAGRALKPILLMEPTR